MKNFRTKTDYELIERSEELKDLFTPNGNKWNELMELLEIERELTLREEEASNE